MDLEVSILRSQLAITSGRIADLEADKDQFEEIKQSVRRSCSGHRVVQEAPSAICPSYLPGCCSVRVRVGACFLSEIAT